MGGRRKGTPNKATVDIKEAARKYSPAAIERLAQLAGLIDGQAPAEAEAARVAACKEILDRAHGKAPQAMTGEGGEGPVTIQIITGVPRPNGSGQHTD